MPPHMYYSIINERKMQDGIINKYTKSKYKIMTKMTTNVIAIDFLSNKFSYEISRYYQ